MERWIAAVLVASMSAVTSTTSLGQQVAEPEFARTREWWQQRVEEARRHSEGFVASVRTPSGGASPSTESFADPKLAREQRRQSEHFIGARGASSATPANGDFDDSALTREQWQQRVEGARQRSEEFVANARVEPPGPPSRDFQQKEASERAMNDPTLQPGDMVSTDKGIVVFVGRDEERKPGDFRAATPDKQ